MKKKSGFIVLGLGVSSDEQVNSGLNRSLGCRLKTVRHCKRNGSMSENFYLRKNELDYFLGIFYEIGHSEYVVSVCDISLATDGFPMLMGPFFGGESLFCNSPTKYVQKQFSIFCAFL